MILLGLVLLAVGCESGTKPGALGAEQFQGVIQTLCKPAMEGRDAGTDGIVLARDFLIEHFKASGLEPAFVIDGKPSYTQPFEVKVGVDEDGEPVYATVENVGALLPGSGALKDEVVVVGGHYDHVGYGEVGARDRSRKGEIHPGADDNASGTAGVLLVARQMAMAEHEPDASRRTILFTGFAGEERGLLGSRYMTRQPEQWAFGGDVVAMINLDMIGRLRHDELFVFTADTGDKWRAWIDQANEAVGLDLVYDVRPPGGSDHSLFIAVDVPAVFFNTWLHPDYHTPGDTPDKINAEGGAKVMQLVAGLTELAATTPDPLVFQKPTKRGPRPRLGVAYSVVDGGLQLDEFRKKSQLQEAGAQVGDLIVSMNGRAVTGRSDMFRVMLAADVGDELDIELKRDGKRIKLRFDLAGPD